MADRELVVKISADVAGYTKGVNEAAKAGDSFGKSQKSAGESMASFAKKAVSVLAVGAAVKSTMSLGMEFQTSLNEMGAVSGATAAQMDKVAAAARALGNDVTLPATSAATAAAAMTELAKGGLSVEESMAAAKGTLQLAAAAQIDGAQAAGIQARALNTFGLAGKDAGMVADVLANTANAASGEITDFAQAMGQVGLVARGFGISIKDTSTALGIFANNGMLGSDAGTSLKAMLVALASPTKQQAAALKEMGVNAFDANGQFVGMRSLTEQLAAAAGRMSTEQYNAAASTAFGTDALRAAQAIAAGGVQAWDKMSAAVGRAGGAAELAAAKTKGLRGALEIVKNAVEDAQLAIFDQLSPSLEQAALRFADMVPAIADQLGPALANLGTGLVTVAEAVMPLIPAVANALAPAFTILGTGAKYAADIIGPLAGLASDLLGAIANLPGPVQAAALAFTGWALFGDKITSFLTSLPAKAKAAGTSLSAAFGPAGLAIAGVTAVVGIFADEWGKAAQRTAESKARVDDLTASLDENTGAITANTAASVADSAVKSGLAQRLKDAGINLKDYTDAVLGNEGAQRRLNQQFEAAKRAIYDKELSGLSETLAAAGVSQDELNQAIASGDWTGIRAKVNDYDKAMGSGLSNTKNFGETIHGLEIPLKNLSDLQGEVAGRTGEVSRAQEQWAMKAEATGKAAADAAPKVQGLAMAMDDGTAGADDLTLAQMELKAATDGTASSMPGLTSATNDWRQSAENAADAQKALQDKVSDLMAMLDQMNGRQRSVEDANRDLSEATDELATKFIDAETKAGTLNDSLVNTDGTINTTTESGRELYDQVNEIAEANLTAAQAAYENGKKQGGLAEAQSQANASAQAGYDAFMAAATAAGIGAEQADLMAQAMGLIPRDVVAAIRVQDDATPVLSIIRQQLDGLPGSKTVTITTNRVTNETTYRYSAQGDAARWMGGTLPGYARGTAVPYGVLGLPAPGDPRLDNLLGSSPRGMFAFRGDEFIMNPKASKTFRSELMAMNAAVPAYSGGGGPVGRATFAPNRAPQSSQDVQSLVDAIVSRVGNSVTVQAQTNADPAEIARIADRYLAFAGVR